MTQTLVPVEHEMQVYQTMAKSAVASKFYRSMGDTSAVMSIMLSARELGISPMSALNGGLNIIQGKVEISARMMNAMIRRAGGSIQTVVCTPTECKLVGKRSDNGDSEEVGFTFDEAKKAGLVKPSGGWQKYPADMLYARALSRLARRLFPDVIGCSYVEGEISAELKPENLPAAEVDVDVEVELQALTDLLDKFKDKFSSVSHEVLSQYIKLVHDKFDLSYELILEKYLDNPDAFYEKFEKWSEKRSV